MKKNLKKILAAIIGSCMLAASLCACGDSKDKETETTAAVYTVTFMNGETKLGDVSVKEGEIIAQAEYEKYERSENAEFLGWFETPSFLEASEKDLETVTFSKDTILYGNFKLEASVTDERVWYIAGTSENGPLKDSAWAGANVDENTRAEFELKATGNNINEFAITIDLYNGDQFQIIHDWSWEGQKGYGYFKEPDPAMFENGGGLGGTDNKSNVNVIMDGNYTITITTNPEDEEHDSVTITRNGDIK